MKATSKARPIIKLLKVLAGLSVAIVVLFAVCGPMAFAPLYALRSSLSAHPERDHGTHPAQFLGLWVKEEPVEFGFRANAIGFLADGEFAGTRGTLRRSWHFDDSRMYFDHVSCCGNCYQGVVTAAFKVEFDGDDRIKLTVTEYDGYARDIGGWYRRTEITDELVARMESQKDLDDYAISSQARSVLDAIEHMERGSSK